MIIRTALLFFVAALSWNCCCLTGQAQVFLNESNTTVTLGDFHNGDPEPFANRSTEASLMSLIDAPSADASELHSQSTHIWVSGDELEVVFDFGQEYDLTTLHFWNYHGETYDVDDIDLEFFDSNMNTVGTLEIVSPELGNETGSNFTPIFAEDFALDIPGGVRFVTARLSGTNNQIDFNNMAFTGELDVNGPVLGDANQDGNVNFLDIAAFIQVLASGEYQAESDMDQNGVVDFLDIDPFIDWLAALS